MATSFFLTTTAGTATSTFTTAVTKRLQNGRGSGAVSQVDASVATLVAAANPQGTGAVSPAGKAASTTLAAAGVVESGATIGASFFWVSEPITAVTIAGTITANLRAAENSNLTNYGIGCKLYRITTAGAVTTAFAQASNVTELTLNTETAMSISLTPTSTAFLDGQRIGVLVFFVGVGASTSGHTATLWYNGVAGSATGDTFLSFTEAITLYAPFVAPQETVNLRAVPRGALF